MKRVITAAVAAAAVSGLAACGSSASTEAATSVSRAAPPVSSTASSEASSATPTSSATPSATPTVKATTVSDGFKWRHSVCSKLDVEDVAEAVGAVPTKQHRLVHSEIGYLTVDYCQFDLVTSSPYGQAASFGMSADTWTRSRWKQLKKNSLRGDDTLKSIKLGAHGALVSGTTGWVLVGDHVLSVLAPFKGTETQTIALMKMAMPHAKSVKPWPALLGIPECGKANEQATAVIGGPVTIRRDEMSDGSGKKVPMCGWATTGGSVSLYGMYAGTTAASQIHREAKRVKDAEKIEGLGKAAVYYPSSAELHIATKKFTITIESTGSHINKKRLVALARVMLPAF